MKLHYRFLLLATLMLLPAILFAQADTVRVMQYNLLTYGDGVTALSYKDARLKKIISYVQPDIFGANELYRGAANYQNLLSNVLGTAQWESGSYMNTRNAYQYNMLFWKKSKFGLARQTSVSSVLRDLIAFKLYYKDPALAQTRDTTFLTIIVVHLKAGTTASDSVDRSAETNTVVAYLNSLNVQGNYILMGDMNVYNSSEACYQNLVSNPNTAYRFFDPLNMPGRWHANSSFASIHTQSTRMAALADGGATGGLDDRLDHMLMSGYIINNQAKVKYLSGSYIAVGQDGRHYNKALIDAPVNTSAPDSIIQALYEMSDHLPVRSDLVFTTSGASAVPDITTIPFTISNPVYNDQVVLFHNAQLAGQALSINLYNMDGRKLMEQKILASADDIHLDVPGSLLQGLYLLQVTDAQGHSWVQKLVKAGM